MKKLFVIGVILGIFIFSNACAQFGLELGVNHSTWKMEYEGESDSDSGIGYQIGGFYRYQFPTNEKLSLKVGLLYFIRNYDWEETDTYYSWFYGGDVIDKGEGTTTFNTIQLPILFYYTFNEQWYGIAGITYVMENSGKGESTWTTTYPDGTVEKESYSYDFEGSDWKENDIDLTFGVGMMMPSGNMNICPELKLQYDLTPDRDDSDVDYTQYSIVIGVGLLFNK